MGPTSTDRIEKQVVLRAPRAKVWRALADAPRFGAWFGVDLRGASFTPGARVRGKVTHPGYEHLTWEAVIERIETYLSSPRDPDEARTLASDVYRIRALLEETNRSHYYAFGRTA